MVSERTVVVDVDAVGTSLKPFLARRFWPANERGPA
jgi:hypothetical protein